MSGSSLRAAGPAPVHLGPKAALQGQPGQGEGQPSPTRPTGVLIVQGAAAKKIKGLVGPGPRVVYSRAGAASKQREEGP